MEARTYTHGKLHQYQHYCYIMYVHTVLNFTIISCTQISSTEEETFDTCSTLLLVVSKEGKDAQKEKTNIFGSFDSVLQEGI